jgi:hypothetical protein
MRWFALGIAVAAMALAECRSAAAQALIEAMPPSVAPMDGPVVVFPPIEYPNSGVWGDTSDWTWQVLPSEVLYHSYLAGDREPRFASQIFHERDQGWLWDVSLGGRAGILRYGSEDHLHPEGYQVDIEGAAFPRLTFGEHRDVLSVDFRFGVPFTYRQGPWETKFGYYHLSSHLGDEYLELHPGAQRLEYVRDVLILGVALRPSDNWRLYAETGWAFYLCGGARPWELQFGVEYSTMLPTGFQGSPFLAVNTRLRQELNFGGNLVVQTGWQWRGETGRLFRLGLHYLNGASDQFQFHRENEEQIGFGMWYDF